MSKKGTLIANFYTFIIATVILAVILIIFYFIVSAGGTPKEEALSSSALLNDADNILSIYLNSQAAIDGKGISIPELISLYFFDKNKYKPSIEQATKEILNKATYEFVHPSSKEKMIKSYALVIYENKADPSFMLKIEADRFRIAYYPNVPSVGVYVPVSEDKSVYVGLWEGEKII